MAKQRPQLINDEVYHISSRTVGDTVVFKNTDDFYRGIFSIYEFNNSNPVSILRRRQERKSEKNKAVRRPTSYSFQDNNDKFF